jgi:flagellar biosynthesis chaperone FliJ
MDRLAKVSISDADKRVFQQYIDELNGNIAKNRSNIQLLAKELQKTSE